MAKNDKQESVPEASVGPSPQIMVRAPQIKTYAFEQWAKLKNLPARHLSGMRAWLGAEANFKHPLDKWDELFKSY
jgi:hypothetical protein